MVQEELLLYQLRIAGNVGIGTSTPNTKLDVAGDITVSGTVDGRDLAADGIKLDGIEAGATAGGSGSGGGITTGKAIAMAMVFG